MMKNRREQLSLWFLAAVYLLAGLRYFPGKPGKSLLETLIHLLSVAPINLGISFLIVAGLERLVGERLPINRSLRIYLVVGLCLEFLLGLSQYITQNSG